MTAVANFRSVCLALCWVFAAGTASAHAHVFKDCPNCGDMVVIPAGHFRMGFEGGETDRYEGPVREVTIARAFAVGVMPVTNAQFRRFVDATHYQMTIDCVLPIEGSFKAVAGARWRDRGEAHAVRDDEPVVCVNWADAHAYVEWLARLTGKPYRLLSEAEYEYVARAGSTGAFAWGDDPDAACRYSNLADASIDRKIIAGRDPASCNDGFAGLAPVGSLRANAFGVKDVNGNAWSWVEDCYRMPYPDAPVDGTAVEAQGPCDRRSVRGASWATVLARTRPSFRGRDDPTLTSVLFGVRVARDLPAERTKSR